MELLRSWKAWPPRHGHWRDCWQIRAEIRSAHPERATSFWIALNSYDPLGRSPSMPARPPAKRSGPAGIHVGDVGGNASFSALGDIVGGHKVTTITTTIQISVEAVTQRPLVTPIAALNASKIARETSSSAATNSSRACSLNSAIPMSSLSWVHQAAANHPWCEPACSRGCRSWSARGFATLPWFLM